MNSILDWAKELPAAAAIGWLLVFNVSTFGLAVVAGCIASAVFRRRRIVASPEPLTWREVAYPLAGVAVNTAVTICGWYLWKAGILQIRRDTSWRAWLDFPILILLMDFGMYALHRLVHWRWLYPIHRLHHDYERPWALTLFVMNPLETLGFGLLWLAVVVLYSSSWLGLSLYLAANLAAGTLGHLGVEPFPSWWTRVPVAREVGTSTFHARHHQDVEHNFGFYTVIWDRLFGTLWPSYDRTFGAPLEPQATSPADADGHPSRSSARDSVEPQA